MHNIARIIKHPSYVKQTSEANLALIELTSEIVFSSAAQAVALPETTDVFELSGKITGWGASTSGLFNDYLLRSATVNHIDRVDCRKLLEIYGGISDDMICAGSLNAKKASCFVRN